MRTAELDKIKQLRRKGRLITGTKRFTSNRIVKNNKNKIEFKKESNNATT